MPQMSYPTRKQLQYGDKERAWVTQLIRLSKVLPPSLMKAIYCVDPEKGQRRLRKIQKMAKRELKRREKLRKREALESAPIEDAGRSAQIDEPATSSTSSGISRKRKGGAAPEGKSKPTTRRCSTGKSVKHSSEGQDDGAKEEEREEEVEEASPALEQPPRRRRRLVRFADK